MCFTLRLHMSAAPTQGGLTQALGRLERLLRSAKNAAWIFVVASLVSFAAGIALARAYLCGAPGPWAFLASLVFCCLGALAFWVAAWHAKSWRLALVGASVAGLAIVLQFLSLAVTLPGCSGV
jgi:hypothetical protein